MQLKLYNFILYTDPCVETVENPSQQIIVLYFLISAVHHVPNEYSRWSLFCNGVMEVYLAMVS